MDRYEKYKDSGVQWLGEIPSHWSERTVAYSVDKNVANSFIDGDWIESDVITSSGIRYLTTGNIGCGSYKEQGDGFISEQTFKVLNCTEVFPGDIIISRLNEPIGRCCIIPDLGKRIIVAVDNVVFRPDENIFSKKYLVYIMNSYQYSSYTSLIARGSTMHRISRSMLGKIKIPIPPLKEQLTMVSYLDSVTAKIDEAIAQQQKMIELLNERKQIIIQNVVTKGLNPDVKMKDSGVEWIGEIPEGWEVLPFKRVAEIILGKMLKNGPESKSYPYFCARDVHMLSINYDDLKKMVFSPVERKMYAVKRGDMLVVEGGASGSSAIVKRDIRDVYIQNSIMIVRGREKVVINDYMCYFLNAIVNRGYSECVCNKATIMHFTKDKLSNTLLPIPSIEEQSAIIKYLDLKSDRLDSIIETCQKKISLLRERKQIVINEVVTGKVKVS